jgi:hypothetical protein
MYAENKGPQIVKQDLKTISHYNETNRLITEKDAQKRLSYKGVTSECIAKCCTHASDLNILHSLSIHGQPHLCYRERENVPEQQDLSSTPTK